MSYELAVENKLVFGERKRSLVRADDILLKELKGRLIRDKGKTWIFL